MQNAERWEPDERSNLRRLWSIVRRELWLIIGCAFAATLVAAGVAQSLPPVYSATATLWIEFDEPSVVTIDANRGLDMSAQRYYETQLEILRSRPLVDAVIDELDLLSQSEFRPPRTQTSSWRAYMPDFLAPPRSSRSEGRADAIKAYRDRLSIDAVDGTLIVRVSFDSSDPQLAANVANAHARAYVEMMLDAKLVAAPEVRAWMQERLEEAVGPGAASRTKQTLGEGEPSAALRSIRLAELRQRLANGERPYRQVLEASSSTALQSVSEISDDPGVRAAQTAFAVAQQEVAELGKRYGPMHPAMIAALAERDRAKADLDEHRASIANRIRRDYEAVLAEESALVASLAGAPLYDEQERRPAPSDRTGGFAESTDLLEVLVDRISRTIETNGLSIAQARVIESALAPRTPLRPQKLVIIGGTFIGAIVIGMVVALMNDSLTNTLRGVQDIEERLRRPMLSMVPLLAPRRLKNIQNGIIEDGPYREAMRTLRSSILLDNSERTHKVVLVTSAVNEEGKSTIALNLAAAFAATGKVLIIDADMRRPTIGRLLDLPRYDAGLSELVTRRAPFKSCLAKTKIPNLHVIRTGFIPSDPLELFAHRRLAKILRVLAQAYDQIVIDAPAILAVSDAAVLSKYADAVVFVARADSTPVPVVENGLSLLKRVDAPIAGVVLNQLDMRKAARYSAFGAAGYPKVYAASSPS